MIEVQHAPITTKRVAGNVIEWKRDGQLFLFSTPEVSLALTVISQDIIRFRFAPEGYFEDDFSYAIKPGFKPEPVNIEVKETKSELRISTHTLNCFVAKTGLLVRIEDKNGNILVEDEKGFHWEDYQDFGGYLVYTSKKIQKNECFFGMGDKPTELDLKGKRISNWNTDTYGYEKDQDPLYRSIPFYYSLHNGTGYGIFLDNTFKTNFDFGKENDSVLSFWADGGEMNYYFINGPELLDVASRFTTLTGTPELPPMWALGYHQCKWSYYPEQKVREIATEFRKRKIPCDSIYLDIDYMEGFRCFTWNLDYFPDPPKMVEDLKKSGFKTVVIIDPGIKIDPDYPVFREGIEKDYFCHRADGPLMKGAVWPGDCHFPDFTKPEVREWWGTLFEEFARMGIAGIWNDMNEPAVFGLGTFPNDVRHDFDGHPCSHRKAHNVYGMQMSRATREGMKKHLNGKRPFTITRSGYAGMQRHTSVWTGDNIATWEHLWLANMQCQRLSISGVSFCGSDIGGFTGDPDPELFARWIQLGVFHPFMRAHSSGDKGDKEPWVFGETIEAIARKYIELRYKLLPYIYTTFWQYAARGVPMVRPLTFINQKDPDTYFRKEEFQFGDNLFTCPVSKKEATNRRFYLPQGKWYDYWTDELYKGAQEMSEECPLDSCPIFVKAGAVLPHYPVMQYTGEKKIEALILHVYYAESPVSSELYEDSGEDFDYKEGDFIVKKFITDGTAEGFVLTQLVEGPYQTDYSNYEIRIHGVPFMPKSCLTDGKVIKWLIEEKTVVVACSALFAKLEVIG